MASTFFPAPGARHEMAGALFLPAGARVPARWIIAEQNIKRAGRNKLIEGSCE